VATAAGLEPAASDLEGANASQPAGRNSALLAHAFARPPKGIDVYQASSVATPVRELFVPQTLKTG